MLHSFERRLRTFAVAWRAMSEYLLCRKLVAKSSDGELKAARDEVNCGESFFADYAAC